MSLYLLDTCTLLWLAGAAHDQISTKALKVLEDHPDLLSVSAISALEIGIKVRQGKLRIKSDPRTWFVRAIDQHALHEIPVQGSIAAASTLLPLLHKDPCDRIIVATAQAYDLVVLTPDERIACYPDLKTLW